MAWSWLGRTAPATPEAEAGLRLAQAREIFEAALADLLDCAEAAQAEGSAEWDQLLDSLQVPVEAACARRSSAQDGLAQSKGAPLGEVRLALTALVEQAEREYWAIHSIHPFLEGFAAHRSRLSHAVKQETDRYSERVKPKAALANVFATALQSTLHHAGKAGPRKLQTMRCRKCGAPRLDDQVVACAYCGHALFE